MVMAGRARLYDKFAAPALRRDDDRPVGRLLVAVAPGGRAGCGARGHHSTWSRGAPAQAKLVVAGVLLLFRAARSTWASTILRRDRGRRPRDRDPLAGFRLFT
jgi:hypothetical protein